MTDTAVASSRTILIVEDDDEAMERFDRAFRAAGWSTVEARNGSDAIALVKAGLRPTAALVDIGLPGASGFDVLRQITASTPDTRALACSSLEDPILVATCRRAGAADFVAKSKGVGEALRLAEAKN
ncbi:MAG: response regulator [Gemmatimonadales bacterium]|jgi:two-component system response regulator EvgA